jgi:hypothetical protein
MVRLSALLNITDLIYMKTSVSSTLNILCVMFKIIALFILILFARLFVRIDILLKCGNNLHGHIIGIRGEIRPEKINKNKCSGWLNELGSWIT